MIFFARLFTLALLLVAAVAAIPRQPTADKITTEQVVTRLSGAIRSLKTLRCTVHAQERVGSQYQPQHTSLKITSAPFRVYVRNQKGIEVLWVTGQNSGKAWVYPNSFPYVTVSLDPNGSLMRKGQHHGLMQAGFGSIGEIIQGSPNRIDHTYERSFRYIGDSLVQGRPCYVLRSDFPQFRYVSYKAGKGETIAQVAEKFGCGEYRISERNDLDFDEPIPDGKTLLVPNAYGRRTILCVETKQYLPISVQVFDDKGLYEKFEFVDIIANQPIPLVEFTKDYKGYKL